MTDHDRRINEIRERLQPIEEANERAEKRRLTRAQGSWHFAVISPGFAGSHELAVEDIFRIVRVEEPPGLTDLARVVEPQTLYPSIARWVFAVSYELVTAPEIADLDDAMKLVWNLVAALRLERDVHFLVPAVASESWATLAAAPASSVHVHLLEDVPNNVHLRTHSDPYDQESIRWISDNFERIATLRVDERFHYSLQCLFESSGMSDSRMTAATIWSGLESIVGAHQEIRYRLSAVLASLATPPGGSRFTEAKRIRRLYDVRSRIIHGGSVDDTAILDHVTQARNLLRTSLLAILPYETMPSADELDALVFRQGQ